MVWTWNFMTFPNFSLQAFIQALLPTAVFCQRLSFFTVCTKIHFRHTFWLSSIVCPSMINTREYCCLVIQYTKPHHPNLYIKVGNTLLSLSCWWAILSFFRNHTWQSQSVMFSLKLLLLKKKLYDPFLWMEFSFYFLTRTSWCSFSRPQKEELPGRLWSHPTVFNPGPLDWESSNLTTRPLLV